MHGSDDLYIIDIIEACRQVSAYVAQGSRERLGTDPMFRDAIIRQLEIVGEAAGRLSSAFKQAVPEVPWEDVVNMRHRLIHGYSKVDLDLVWQAAVTDAPRLARTLEPWKPQAPPEGLCP